MLSIIIPTRDKAPRLKLCLRALASVQTNSSGGLPEVIVVDDCSSDATNEVLAAARRALGEGLRVVQHDEPVGRAAARNAGAAAATGRRLLFLDDDILVGAEVLAEHRRAPALRDHPVLARSTILNLPWMRAVEDPSAPPESLPLRLAERARRVATCSTAELRRHARRSAFEADLHRLLARRMETGRWPASTGGNLSIDREHFFRLGGFDERMGLRWGVEDLEFGLRAERDGAYIAHLDTVSVLHMDHPVARRAADHAKNLRYFSAKHGAVGERLAAYFDGDRPIESVVE